MLRRILFSLLAAILPSSLFAQAVSGTIYGTVHDASGAAIVGAKVTVVNSNTNYTRTQASGTDGDYLFASMPLGLYTLTVEQAGFDQFVEKAAIHCARSDREERASQTRAEVHPGVSQQWSAASRSSQTEMAKCH